MGWIGTGLGRGVRLDDVTVVETAAEGGLVLGQRGGVGIRGWEGMVGRRRRKRSWMPRWRIILLVLVRGISSSKRSRVKGGMQRLTKRVGRMWI